MMRICTHSGFATDNRIESRNFLRCQIDKPEHFHNWFSVFCRKPTTVTKTSQCSRSCTETMKMV